MEWILPLIESPSRQSRSLLRNFESLADTLLLRSEQVHFLVVRLHRDWTCRTHADFSFASVALDLPFLCRLDVNPVWSRELLKLRRTLLLPLLRRETPRRPSMDGSDLGLQCRVDKPVPGNGCLLLELRRYDQGMEGLAAAACPSNLVSP